MRSAGQLQLNYCEQFVNIVNNKLVKFSVTILYIKKIEKRFVRKLVLHCVIYIPSMETEAGIEPAITAVTVKPRDASPAHYLSGTRSTAIFYQLIKD